MPLIYFNEVWTDEFLLKFMDDTQSVIDDALAKDQHTPMIKHFQKKVAECKKEAIRRGLISNPKKNKAQALEDKIAMLEGQLAHMREIARRALAYSGSDYDKALITKDALTQISSYGQED